MKGCGLKILANSNCGEFNPIMGRIIYCRCCEEKISVCESKKEVIDKVKEICNTWSQLTGEDKSIKLSILFRHLDELTLNSDKEKDQ